MTNEVSVAENHSVASNSMFNFFESYGSQASQTTIIGQLLKFSKGDWLIGTNNTEVKPGKQLVAIMDQLSVGWVKWEDNKPVEQLMGLIVEGHVPLKRKDLGDTDESQWEVDMQGKPRDPWQFTNNLVLREVGLASNDEDHMYTFATSSRGGISAIGELCKSFGKAMRQRPDEYPIIELATDSYVHPIKEYGRIKTPVMNVISWEKKEPVAEQKAIPARKAK